MDRGMFTLGLERRFVARHRLVGGDWGAENELHSHSYRLELRLEGRQLDSHSFLVDLVDLERHLDSLVRSIRPGAQRAGGLRGQRFARAFRAGPADGWPANHEPPGCVVTVRLWKTTVPAHRKEHDAVGLVVYGWWIHRPAATCMTGCWSIICGVPGMPCTVCDARGILPASVVG
jgi:hypothetical protein